MGSHPEAIAIGDVNSDSRNDLVVVTSWFYDAEYDARLHVFLQDEDGQLHPPLTLHAGVASSVAIGDLNGDNRNDVAVGNSNSVGVFWQTDSGELAPMETILGGGRIYRVAIGDLNNDMRSDLVASDWSSDFVMVVSQNSSGALDMPTSHAAPHYSGNQGLRCADVSGDGLNDIVLTSGVGLPYDVVVITQNPGGGLNPYRGYDVPGGYARTGIAIGDVNADSHSDVIVTLGGGDPNRDLALFLQNTSGSLSSPFILSAYQLAWEVGVGDFNVDGLVDIAVSHRHWSRIGILLQTDHGAFLPEELYEIPYTQTFNADAIAVEDINSDGAPDIAMSGWSANGVFILYGVETSVKNIDLLPGSCPNIINTGGIDLDYHRIRPGAAAAAKRPTVPVAVLGTKTFDVSRVDPATILVEGLTPVSHRLMDVSRPVAVRETDCECTTSGADGFVDLVLYFDQAQLLAALGPITDGEVRTLTLSGKTKTGVPLSGSDCVTIKEGPIRISPLASAGEKVETGFAAYPNPFNAATVISFALSTDSDVRVDVYDVLGRRVATLVDDLLPAGEHHVSWDAIGAASGVYFARLVTSEGMTTRKMVLVR
jgi:hypothetical protein